MFPIILIITLFIEGIKVIRHEGLRPSNFLTMLFSVLLYLYLAVWPVVGGLEKHMIRCCYDYDLGPGFFHKSTGKQQILLG